MGRALDREPTHLVKKKKKKWVGLIEDSPLNKDRQVKKKQK